MFRLFTIYLGVSIDGVFEPYRYFGSILMVFVKVRRSKLTSSAEDFGSCKWNFLAKIGLSKSITAFLSRDFYTSNWQSKSSAVASWDSSSSIIDIIRCLKSSDLYLCIPLFSAAFPLFWAPYPCTKILLLLFLWFTPLFLLITRDTTQKESTLLMGLFFLPHLLSIILCDSDLDPARLEVLDRSNIS